MRDLHLTIRNGGGSVEHYHHFLLGFLVPLVHQRDRIWANPNFAKVLIRSCGPMDRLIGELKSDKIVIVDKTRHHELAKADAPQNGLDFMMLRGFDYPVRYDCGVFAVTKKILEATLKAEIEREREEIAARFGKASPKIVLIERGAPDPFYLSDRAEAKSAGSARRSIKNHEELRAQLAARFGHCLNLRLEGFTLARQIALYSAADIIVAQHGAALSNMVWAHKRAGVIEISPATIPEQDRAQDYFRNLARCLGLRYCRVEQAESHGAVDIDRICAAIENIVRPARNSISDGAARTATKYWLTFRARLRSRLRR